VRWMTWRATSAESYLGGGRLEIGAQGAVLGVNEDAVGSRQHREHPCAGSPTQYEMTLVRNQAATASTNEWVTSIRELGSNIKHKRIGQETVSPTSLWTGA
jgi:hypothetical protein